MTAKEEDLMSLDTTNIQGAQLGRWEKLKKAKAAYKSARFYMWIGLIAGFSLLATHRSTKHLAEWLSARSGANAGQQALTQLSAWLIDGLGFVFEHLGIGLIVAAIAVFFYEWGAHIKETVDLSSRLTGAVEHTKRMMEAIRMNERLGELNARRAEDRLAYSLDTLIGGANRSGDEKPEYLDSAISNCKNLVLALASLQKRNDWASEQYVTFISNHIHKVVGHNADAFSKLHEKKGEQTFNVPPTAAQMADEILAAQMQSVNSGGRYDVISDLPSWQGGQLALLNSATKYAIEEKSVQVRRVFNLIRGTPQGTKQLLLKHLDYSDRWKSKTGQGGYEVRILSAKGYEKLKSRGYSIKKIEDAHLGIFSDGSDKVRFKVTEPDLSDMLLSKDPDRVKPEMEMFEAVWRVAAQFPAGHRTNDHARDQLDQILHELEEWKGERS
jgi:hypothetical protein